jgi:cytochrome b6-f complex iron-sulfur subunit
VAEHEDINRRDFFSEVVAAAFGIAGLGSVAVTYQYLSPNALFEPPLMFRAGTPDLYPLNSVTYIADQQVYIVHEQEGFYAVSAVCTHLGCITKWNPDADMIACPCHGSKFRSDGTKIEGPAPRPLVHWSIALAANGDLMVDKTEPAKNGQALKV